MSSLVKAAAVAGLLFAATRKRSRKQRVHHIVLVRSKKEASDQQVCGLFNQPQKELL